MWYRWQPKSEVVHKETVVDLRINVAVRESCFGGKLMDRSCVVANN
jgi:hypothetical protein